MCTRSCSTERLRSPGSTASVPAKRTKTETAADAGNPNEVSKDDNEGDKPRLPPSAEVLPAIRAAAGVVLNVRWSGEIRVQHDSNREDDPRGEQQIQAAPIPAPDNGEHEREQKRSDNRDEHEHAPIFTCGGPVVRRRETGSAGCGDLQCGVVARAPQTARRVARIRRRTARGRGGGSSIRVTPCRPRRVTRWPRQSKTDSRGRSASLKRRRSAACRAGTHLRSGCRNRPRSPSRHASRER